MHSLVQLFLYGPISVAARPMASVFDRSLAVIAGSNTAGDMDVRLFWVLYVVK